MIVGIDTGKYQTRVVYSPIAKFSFKSKLYPFKEVWGDLGPFDFVIEFNGEKYIGGDLGDREGEIPIQYADTSKAHYTTLINALAGLHQLNDDRFKIVLGSPIGHRSEDEKQAIKRMMKGKHTITINGIAKDIYIVDCEIGPEGAAGYWGENIQYDCQGLDFGSTTINYFVYEGKKLIGKSSDTIPFGAENSTTYDPEGIMKAVSSQLVRKFSLERPTIVLGGKAGQMYPHVKKIYPNAFMAVDPIYATAKGFYQIARAIYD